MDQLSFIEYAILTKYKYSQVGSSVQVVQTAQFCSLKVKTILQYQSGVNFEQPQGNNVLFIQDSVNYHMLITTTTTTIIITCQQAGCS